MFRAYWRGPAIRRTADADDTRLAAGQLGGRIPSGFPAGRRGGSEVHALLEYRAHRLRSWHGRTRSLRSRIQQGVQSRLGPRCAGIRCVRNDEAAFHDHATIFAATCNWLAVKTATLRAATSARMMDTHFEDLLGIYRCLDQAISCAA